MRLVSLSNRVVIIANSKLTARSKEPVKTERTDNLILPNINNTALL